ncbi:hypothetical protein BT96DRAFT_974697 [Gymnopus androsaceus JB14]|uniref:Transcription factor domain-containing protein n=1 Tax=Gymnopus androsaceus JB14 TaxID=1447944 RepID=A0A6A4HYD9_9AGAR|nr:hypothetical protein BT96DRAFT_974697 [Gymnopus androsaceus JB14]
MLRKGLNRKSGLLIYVDRGADTLPNAFFRFRLGDFKPSLAPIKSSLFTVSNEEATLLWGFRLSTHFRAILAEHRARLEALEQAVNILPIGSPTISSSPISMKKHFSMDGVALGAPIATLRTLSSLSEDERDSFSGNGMSMNVSDSLNHLTGYSPTSSSGYDGNLANNGRNQLDPVTRGVLSMDEGQALFDIFFAHCHSLAPVLCTRIQSDASFAISQLLLRPTPSDMKVEAVQALLIYVQWMPIDVSPTTATTGPSSPSSPHSFADFSSLPSPRFNVTSARSRFSDTSAWSLVGLAIRLANFLGLDRSVDAPFTSPDISDDAMIRMRTWMNLLSIDHHLTLTARLPASLDPVPAARAARSFASSPRAEPTDLKAKFAGDSSLRVLDRVSLQKANAELNEWESMWAMALSSSGFNQYRTQMPFTALRWTRLALNVVSLGPRFLGNHADELRTPCTSALRNAVEAAASMLYCFSSKEQESTMGPLIVDAGALSSFKYSIDAYWITHAFAIVFLAMAYERGVINDDLSLVDPSQLITAHVPIQDVLSYPSRESPLSFSVSPSSGYTSSRTVPLQECSALYRLGRLAADVFASAAIQPPATHYRQIVDNTMNALTLRGGEGGMSDSGLGVADMFALVMEEGFEVGSFDSIG